MESDDGTPKESISVVCEALTAYLQSLASSLLLVPAPLLSSNAFKAFLETEESLETLTRFISQSEVSLLFVGFDAVNGTFHLSDDARAISIADALNAFAVIKCSSSALSLETGPLLSQISVVSLNLGGHATATGNLKYVPLLQQYTRSFVMPLIAMITRDVQQSSASSSGQLESLTSLQKKARELDGLLDQCQAGAVIPSVSLVIEEFVAAASKRTTAVVLKGLLEKWNVSQVDALLAEIGLNSLLESVEKREEIANEINVTAKQWPGEIEKQTRLLDSTFQGADREIQFWKELERKLLETKELLESAPVLLTKLILKRANRVSEQRLKESEMKLDQALETVNISLSFLKDFPIDDILSAADLHPQLSRAATNALSHLSKLKHSKYDIHRAVSLLEAICAMILSRIVSIIRTPNILQCAFNEYAQVYFNSEELFTIWESQIASQRIVLKDIAKRRSQPIRNLQLEHEAVRVRLTQVYKFREQHERLVGVFTSVLSTASTAGASGASGSSVAVGSAVGAAAEGNEVGLITQLQDAYASVVRNVNDILDVTSNGTALWSSAQQIYEKQVERIESRMTRLLEERLSAAGSADEMFRVFSTFNPLFFRPAIKNAVNSFRSTLVKNVQADVRRLQEKFKLRYDDSVERATADIRDIPPLAGRIIWARQIENQLLTLMKRMEDVLGVGWEDHFEGKQLKQVCEELRGYLDTTGIYSEWLQQQLSQTDAHKYSKSKEFLLLVDEDAIGKKSLRVNFDDRQVVVFKEVRYLETLLTGMSTTHKSIPHTIRSQAKEAFARYPVAMALQAALAAFNHAKACIAKVHPKQLHAITSSESNGSAVPTPTDPTAYIVNSRTSLLVSHIQAVRDIIKEALGGSKRTKRWIKWDSPELDDWVSQLSSKVFVLQERVDEVIDYLDQIDELLQSLRTCAFTINALASVNEQIQQVVDEMQSKGLSNIGHWLKDLDSRVQAVLQERCKAAILLWEKSFLASSIIHAMASNGDGAAASADNYLSSGSLKIVIDGVSVDISAEVDKLIPMEQTVHEILVSNQVLYLSPALEQARYEWIAYYQNYMSAVTNLPRLVLSRFAVFASSTMEGPTTYADVMSKIDKDILRKPYKAIEKMLSSARVCVNNWLQYQALWDSSVSEVCSRLGRDIGKWQQLLIEIKTARSGIDSVDQEIAYGPIVVNFRQVQHRINLKYDTWQKEVQQRFGSLLLEEIKVARQEIGACKDRLENISLDGPTRDVISGVEFILKTKLTIDARAQLVDDLESSEKLLVKQRFQFPRDWVSVSNVVGAFHDLKFILSKRSTAMDTHLPMLQNKIREEDSMLQNRTEDLLSRWERDKPLSGSGNPNDMLMLLSMFANEAAKLKDDMGRIKAAKEALSLPFVADTRIAFVADECADLREAWTAIVPASEKLQAIRALLIREINPMKVRKSLDEITAELRQLPAKVRGYSCVESLQESITRSMNLQPVLRDLCTEALKERHWKIILNGLNIRVYLSELSVGDIYESNPLSQKKLIQEVLSTAQGELAIEQFLKDLKEQWTGAELTLILRDNVRLVSGWDVLFTSLEDNLNSLASLKQSPYFRNVSEFQELTNHWENRLTNLRSIFDVWVEVQRKWVYLRGIFKNPDIKAQLPSQYSKFTGVDNDFMDLMKRVAAKPTVLDLLQLDNLFKRLERQENTMSVIQKALGEYLEKQRQIFPRFYFVNNEDLVEIIGNSNEPGKIVQHLSKMFAAISNIDMKQPAEPVGSGANKVLVNATGMGSKEGEVIAFDSSIAITSAVKEWLGILEREMSVTLAKLLDRAQTTIPTNDEEILKWMDSIPAQIMILAAQVLWTANVDSALSASTTQVVAALSSVLTAIEARLKSLSTSVLLDLQPALRKKCEQLLTEMVHQRDVCRLLVSGGITSAQDFQWLYHLRFYWQSSKTITRDSGALTNLAIKMSNASFIYGYEYLGITERLVETPLTARCYLTLTQALHFRMGGNPFGPAGTGKTESVKMLGNQLGRFVLVFNCDSSFDYAAMGRIFAGLCQVGAWGCFDEFNRLEERILSAVSQQILTIQRGLLMHQESIELLGNSCKLNKDVGIFVTMNPGYAGRSNLPDNLKQLFRAVAMAVPDRKLIAQVMLFSQGIVTAEELAGKVVLLFTLLEEQLSTQSHYDFGLRALKSVLVGAGELKRKSAIASANSDSDASIDSIEREVLIKSICDSVLPKLVADDIPLFVSLLKAVFPGCEMPKVDEAVLLEAIRKVCTDDGLEASDEWIEKVLQLKQIIDMRHGVMLVGPSGTGKSTVWQTLLKALAIVDGVKGEFHVIDPKTVKKEKLYGSLDPNTLEWTDGVFTKTLRKVVEAANGDGTASSEKEKETEKRCWIVFDGDVDPEWAENLNSVLDDNKILTLPSGDRLKLPNSVRIVMEVDSLKYATLATVSRCGMIWFADETITVDVALRHQLQCLYRARVSIYESSSTLLSSANALKEFHKKFVDVLAPFYNSPNSLIATALQFTKNQKHIMPASTGRLLSTLHSLMVRGLSQVLEYNDINSSFPMTDSHLESFAVKWLLVSLLWALGGSLPSEGRVALSDMLLENCSFSIDFPTNKNGSKQSLMDITVSVSDGSWVEWNTFVPKVEIESHKVVASDVIVTTTDTVRHNEVIRAWLSSHKPLILCGPPGSGKTMTLTSVLESMPELVLASLNFSSTTTPELILKTFAQYCEIVDSPDGLVLQPNKSSYRESQWLVVFCDEINLPELDKYGTQTVIMFLRQLVERGGYWNSDCKWITLRRIQFVGACNPPSDAGRVPITERFLRHAPLLFVDYPTEVSLHQIYRCFNHALLKLHPGLRGAVDPLNNAMVEFYLRNQAQFLPDVAPQYIYSPRELSRWVRAMYEAMAPIEAMTMDELVRLWAHEALRLFHDRLITPEEKAWCNALVDEVAARHFPGVDIDTVLQRPLLYSSWLKKTYQSTSSAELKEFVSARLKTFYEEALDVPLVVFDDVLEHVLRIDNVLRHPMGHMLLVGESGVGKTVLSRFVAWMNGLSVFQIKANNRYTTTDFDEDLRTLFKRVCLDGEKICFIFDESNVLSSAFLERMNALLASGEVPGLFEGDERAQLLSQFRESFNQREGQLLDVDDELWRQFTKLIQRNLHVIFTMNPASSDFSNRCTASPALFNRCVVDWFGTWSVEALAQVGHEFTNTLDTTFTKYDAPSYSSNNSNNSSNRSSSDNAVETLYFVFEIIQREKAINKVIEDAQTRHRRPTTPNKGLAKTSSKAELPTLREAVVTAIISFHQTVKHVTKRVGKATGREHYISPRDYLDIVNKFVATEIETRSNLEQQQAHIHTGLNKLLETQAQVNQLRQEMVAKEQVLRAKDTEANNKLSQMVEKQNEAEHRKSEAERLTIELRQQEAEITKRRSSVEAELSEAEPSLLSAKHSVQNIRKTQLDEVRSLIKPPNAVKLTLEMVAVMIGEPADDWDSIRKVIRRDDFISTVVNYDPTALSPKQVKQVQDTYLSNTDMDYNSVDRASKACGPLYQWAVSQIKYAVILKKIKPLRDEVAALMDQTGVLQEQQKAAVEQVEQLEHAIKVYKAEYASAIRDTETIKTEIDAVTKKVARAEALLASLNEEMQRWQSTAASFDSQMATLIGDCLLASAFLTFGGIFDHRIRRSFLLEWSDCLESIGIPFRRDLDMLSYLSTPQEQMKWRGFGLPSDELAMQNAILLEKFYRYPLVIDPSGQAAGFLLKKYAAQKIVQTSFLDSNFLKILASAVRFGTPLLVTDVESLDPILNPVLNREFTKTGGRTLIRLGTEDIDFSPKFVVILITRNPQAKFAPDLCSRVTTVNFTVTPASLESQALGSILKVERPDVEHRRTEVLRQQAEQRFRLRELEDSLLASISAVQGAILDDDVVIKNLEKIKGEASDLNKEVAKTEHILHEVKTVSVLYESLAKAMSEVYFALEKLSSISFLYQFSLQFFLEIVDTVLHSTTNDAVAASSSISPTKSFSSSDTSEYSSLSSKDTKLIKDRVQLLTASFFQEVSRRVLRGLKNNDKLMFMVRLATIRTQGVANKELSDNELAVLLRGSEHLFLQVDQSSSVSAVDQSTAAITTKIQKFKSIFSAGNNTTNSLLSDYSAKQLYALSLLPAFGELVNSMSSSSKSEWQSIVQTDSEPEVTMPTNWLPSNTSSERAALLTALVIRALRPERTLAALSRYVSVVFNDWSSAAADSGNSNNNNSSNSSSAAATAGDWKAYCDLDLASMIRQDSKSSRPIMICSERGQDASGKVDKLSSELNKHLLQVAMGSAEGFVEADRCISTAIKQGSWVLLRNVHLCIDWLNGLEKRVHSFAQTAHAEFRLFLTCEIIDKLPTALLRASEVLIAESTTGVRANLLRFYNSIPVSRVERAPAERSRLYGLLAWLNAVIQERLRYAPLGWTKRYEFSETDANCALDVIDEWVDEVACAGSSGSNGKLKSHVDPRDLPWAALCSLLSQSLYGGRVDDAFDQSVLDSFVNSVFNVNSYSPNAVLVSDSTGTPILSLPDGLSRHAFHDWVANLSDDNSPVWLGLPAKAEIERMKVVGVRVLSNLNQMLSGNADMDVVIDSSDSGNNSNSSSNATKAKLTAVLDASTRYLSALPVAADVANVDEKFASDSKLTPVQRFLVREICKGRKILAVIREEVQSLKLFASGEIKATNDLRTLMKCFVSGTVPSNWMSMYASKQSISLGQWMTDFIARLRALSRYLPALQSVVATLAPAGSAVRNDAKAVYWMGGMFLPETYIMATRQHTAHVNGWSLDDMELFLDVNVSEDSMNESSGVTGAFIEGLQVEGASVDSRDNLQLSEELRCPLPLCSLAWRPRARDGSSTGNGNVNGGVYHVLPLYLNSSRTQLVAEVRVLVQSSVPTHVWRQRGIALLLQAVDI